MSEASIAVAQEPPWSPWRDTALYLNAEAHLLTGNVDQACALFAESSSVAATNSNADCLVLSESELALVAMDRGRWEEAAGRVERALAVVDEHRMHDYATSVLVVAVAARLAVHRGDLEQADRLIARAMRARPSCTFVMPFIAVGVRIQLAKVHLARGTSRPLVTCCVRSTTSCSIDQILAPSSTRSPHFADSSPRARRANAAARRP